MKYYPESDILKQHINHYWIVEDAQYTFRENSVLYEYPGVTPEVILVLKGGYSFQYMGKMKSLSDSKLFSFIHEPTLLNFENLSSFVIIQFKSRALSSLIPFVKLPAKELMIKTELDLNEAFGATPAGLIQKLQSCTAQEIVNVLDEWLLRSYTQHQSSGVFSEAIQEFGNDYSLQNILSAEGYSYSTLERHFKKESGLTPKQYQCLRRYKSAIIEIYETQNPDWVHYVQKYGYFDQSHFIKDIKRFTGFTPGQLLETPSLLSFRSIGI